MNYKYLGLWIVFQSSIFLLGFFLQKNNPGLSTLNELSFSVYISRGAGLCLAINPMLMLLPMCRHTITLIRRYIFIINNIFPDFSYYFHKICAYTILFWGIIHTVCHYINFYGVEHIIKINSMYNLHYTIFAGVSGHLMLISMFFIFVFSGIFFRKYYFELFWSFHHFFVLMFIAYPFHGSGCFVKTNENKCMPYYSGVIFGIIILIYIIERLVREFRPYVKIQGVRYFSNGVFKIKFLRNDFLYKPGQYILLKCDDISRIQWHPFTISSSPNDEFIEITIRCLGNWTTDLKNHLLAKSNGNLSYDTYIQFDGAFGSPIDTICNYNAVILISSGIGITPYISMLKYILQSNRIKTLNIKKIDLIWINRDIEDFEWFNEELDYIEKNSECLVLNFHMFLTEKIKDISRLKIITSETIPHLNYIYKTNIILHYGRPDFNKFCNTYIKNNNNLKVGCFVCSSKKVETCVKKACDKYTNKNVKLICKSESFF